MSWSFTDKGYLLQEVVDKMLSFTFDDKNSYTDFGILISKRPNLPSPERRVSYVPIPGRNSNIKFDEETYEDITITVECSIVGDVYQKISEIRAWLIGAGESELIFSFLNDKKYVAQVVNSIDFEIVLKISSTFVIIFNCQPFKYEVVNTPITILTNDEVIVNPGSIYSEPIVSVFGEGAITLWIENQKVELKNINTKIILDSVIIDAYDDNLMNLNHRVTGDFIKLRVGNNLIRWTGDVRKVMIVPNWRWL